MTTVAKLLSQKAAATWKNDWNQESTTTESNQISMQGIFRSVDVTD